LDKEVFNKWANWWRNTVGVNVIPNDSVQKKPIVRWADWCDGPIPDELHKDWITRGLFKSGLAIVLGRAWHLKDRELYFVCLDADNAAAVEWLSSKSGLQDSGLGTESRGVNYKLHAYFYTTRQLDNYKPEDTDKIKIELKAAKTLVTCTPSEYGQKMEDGACKPTGVYYRLLNTAFPVIDPAKVKMPSAGVTKKTRKFDMAFEEIKEGSRNDKFFNACVSFMKKFPTNKPFDEELAWTYMKAYNQKYVKPPLAEEEAFNSFKSSIKSRPTPASDEGHADIYAKIDL
jgi:hypothetical protein